MENKLYFINDTHFNLSAMMTFGVSAKDSDDSIGYFGTGFKYAVAIILRLGGKIKVISNEKEYVFHCKSEVIRNKEFDIVYMNDQQAGFTTHLGINWEPWMAFRELYANCIDENGKVVTGIEAGNTVIEVESDAVYDAYMSRDKYFFLEKPMYCGKYIDIHNKPSQFIFYKGIAVYQAESNFTFNVKTKVTLSEERYARYWSDIAEPIVKEIQYEMTDESLMESLLTSEAKNEKNLPYSTMYSMSNMFIAVINRLLVTDRGVAEYARRAIRSKQEEVGDFPEFHLTKTQLMMINKAKEFLNKINIPIDDYEIYTVTGLGDDVMGRALEGKIYLSKIPFDHGTKQVASTLLEEWVHLRYKCSDFDRRMQNWLFDKIISIGEELAGEPL